MPQAGKRFTRRGRCQGPAPPLEGRSAGPPGLGQPCRHPLRAPLPHPVGPPTGPPGVPRRTRPAVLGPAGRLYRLRASRLRDPEELRPLLRDFDRAEADPSTTTWYFGLEQRLDGGHATPATA